MAKEEVPLFRRMKVRPAELIIHNVPVKEDDGSIGTWDLTIYKTDPEYIRLSDDEFVDEALRIAHAYGLQPEDIELKTLDDLSPISRKGEERRHQSYVDKWGEAKRNAYNSNHANYVSGEDVNYKKSKKGGKTCMAKSTKQRAKCGQDYYLVPETTRVVTKDGEVKDAPVKVHSQYSVSITTSPENLKAHPTTKDGKRRQKYYHLHAGSWEEAVNLASSVGINGDRVTVTKHDTTILATDTPVRRNSGTIHQWKNEDGTMGKGVTWFKGTGKTIYDNGGVPLGNVKVNKMQRHKRVYMNGKNEITDDDLPF